MKFPAILVLTICSFTFSYSQDSQTILKSDLTFKQPFKAPNGMTYINPIDFKYINLKKGKDSLELKLPFASRFYMSIDSLKIKLTDEEIIQLLKWNHLPSSLDIRQILKPFYIQNHEVTNNEYRTFINQLSKEDRLSHYPDTTRWVNDFYGAYNDPLERAYFAHPKYDDYPVVGVTYFQAMDFCRWIERRLNDEYKLHGFRIEVGMPNQFEWAFANGDKYIWSAPTRNPYYLNQFYDKDYVTDLKVDWDSGFYNLVNRALLPGYANINTGNMMGDGYLYTHSFNQIKKVKGPEVVHKDQVNGVYYLNTNVSEWCSETYQNNWKDLFEWRQKMLKDLGTQEALLTADIEAYYNAFNDTISGQLVRGGNWLYEHHAFRNGVNVGTHDAKLFVDPNSSHSTIGFRYVIRLVEEDVDETAQN